MLNVQFSHANVTMKGRVQKKKKNIIKEVYKMEKGKG